MIEIEEYLVKLRELAATVFRNKFKLLAYNLLVFGFACFVIFFWPRGYRSEAKIWLKIGRENTRIDPTAATGERISIQESDREDEVKSVLDILGGRGVASQIVEQLTPGVVLGDEPLIPGEGEAEEDSIFDVMKGTLGSVLGLLKQIDPVSEKEDAIQQIVENLKVGAERKSNVISIEYDAESPELAQAIVQAAIDRYRTEHARIHRTEGSKGFFDQQREELEARVLECSETLRSAKAELGLATIEGQRAMLEAQLLAVRTEKLNTVQKIEEFGARKQELASQMEQQPQTILSEERVVPNTGRDALEGQLYSLQVQRMALESKMSASNPRLQAIKQQEAEARRELERDSTTDRSETTQSINAIRQQLRAELLQAESGMAGLEALLAVLKKQELGLLADINNLNDSEIDIRSLERNLRLAEKSLTSYSESVEEARIDEALDRDEFSNVSIAQYPTLQEKPVSPSKMLVALMGIAAMMFGSTAIVSGMFLLQSTPRGRPTAMAMDGPASGNNGNAELASSRPRVITIPHQRRYRSTGN